MSKVGVQSLSDSLEGRIELADDEAIRDIDKGFIQCVSVARRKDTGEFVALSLITGSQPTRDPQARILRESRQEIHESGSESLWRQIIAARVKQIFQINDRQVDDLSTHVLGDMYMAAACFNKAHDPKVAQDREINLRLANIFIQDAERRQNWLNDEQQRQDRLRF